MNYQYIENESMLNGEGLRVVLWVSGCSHHCPSCHNPETHSPNSGKLFDLNAINKIYELLRQPHVSGLTFSGGDPLFLKNRKTILRLVKNIKEEFPHKNIWLYTGFLWEDVKDLENIEYIDILVDGRFYKKLKDTKLHWRGSSNQRVIDVKQSLNNNDVILYCE